MRIVLFILKSFNQSMRHLIDLFLRWFEDSFDLRPRLPSKKGQILLNIDVKEEGDFLESSIISENAFPITIGASLLDEKCSFKKAGFKVTTLEAILPIIEAVAHQEFPHAVILLMWPSLVPCAFEKDMPLLAKRWEASRERLFKKMIYDIRRLTSVYGLDVIWIDNREVIGYKNSALLERLFLQSRADLSK